MKWDHNSIVIYTRFFYIEDWAPPSIHQGIGGSEEAVIYLSPELVKLGYQVTVFNECGEMEGEYDGVVYKPVEKFNVEDQFNILIFHRNWQQPMVMKAKARKIGVWMHDNPQFLSAIKPEERAEFLASFDKLFMLSNFHKSMLPDWISEDKIFLTSNGIHLPDFQVNGIERNPKRLIYISDYTRGIEHLLVRWNDILREVPDAELHLFYGWNVINTFIKYNWFPDLPEQKKKLLQLFQQRNIYEHGRVGHQQLVRELLKSGLWVYPCHTAVETFCISALKAQASGCVPIVTAYGGLQETVKSGIKINGPAGDEQTNNALIQAIIDLLKHPEQQEFWRKEALSWKNSFGWDQVAQQWHREFLSL